MLEDFGVHGVPDGVDVDHVVLGEAFPVDFLLFSAPCRGVVVLDVLECLRVLEGLALVHPYQVLLVEGEALPYGGDGVCNAIDARPATGARLGELGDLVLVDVEAEITEDAFGRGGGAVPLLPIVFLLDVLDLLVAV